MRWMVVGVGQLRDVLRSVVDAAQDAAVDGAGVGSHTIRILHRLLKQVSQISDLAVGIALVFWLYRTGITLPSLPPSSHVYFNMHSMIETIIVLRFWLPPQAMLQVGQVKQSVLREYLIRAQQVSLLVDSNQAPVIDERCNQSFLLFVSTKNNLPLVFTSVRVV